MTQEMTNQSIIPFFYVTIATGVLTTATATQAMTLATDSWFKLLEFSGTSDQDDPNDPQPNNFTVSITDQSTGRLFSSSPVPQNIICGPSNQGILEKYPIRFAPGITLIISLVNTAAETAAITFVLKGYKEFVIAG